MRRLGRGMLAKNKTAIFRFNGCNSLFLEFNLTFSSINGIIISELVGYRYMELARMPKSQRRLCL